MVFVRLTGPGVGAWDGFLFFELFFLLLAFDLLNTLGGSGKIFRHGAAQLLDRLSDLAADVVVGLIGGFLALDVFTAQFLIGLSGAEQIGGQFGTTHVVKDLLALFQPLAGVNLFCTKTAIQTLIAHVLEDSEVQGCFDARLLCGFCQRFVMCYHFVTDGKAFLILGQLLVILNQFLLPGFDRKIGLTKSDDLLVGACILNNQIAGIPRKHNIANVLVSCASFYDFVNVNKIVLWIEPTVLASDFCLVDIKKIYDDHELSEEATIRNFRIVQTEGGRQVNRELKHYTLQMIIAVGFKVNNPRAVQFRKWAGQIVKDHTIQGWTMDKERLKKGHMFTDEYFERQLQYIREIRLSERKFYQKVTDLYATAFDYDKDARTTRLFFQTVQNKLHYAVHRHTAAELIVERADAAKEHMGLTTWENAPDGKIVKTDVIVAKNYLSEKEMSYLERILRIAC